MERIEVDVVTGERTVVQLTAEEVADAEASTAKELRDRANAPPTLEQRVAAIEKKLGL